MSKRRDETGWQVKAHQSRRRPRSCRELLGEATDFGLQVDTAVLQDSSMRLLCGYWSTHLSHEFEQPSQSTPPRMLSGSG